MAKVRDKKGRSFSPASHSKSKQTDGEGQSSEESGNKRENSLDKSEIPCWFKFCTSASCKFWHPSVSLNFRPEKDVYTATNATPDMLRQKESPAKKSKKGGAKGSVAMLKESIQLGCVSQDSYPRKYVLREQGKLGSKHTVKISKGTWHQIRNSGNKGVHREGSSKRVRLMSVVHARQKEKSHDETLHRERCVRMKSTENQKHQISVTHLQYEFNVTNEMDQELQHP